MQRYVQCFKPFRISRERSTTFSRTVLCLSYLISDVNSALLVLGGRQRRRTDELMLRDFKHEIKPMPPLSRPQKAALGIIIFFTYFQFDIIIDHDKTISRFLFLYPAMFVAISVVFFSGPTVIRKDIISFSLITAIIFAVRIDFDSPESALRYLIFLTAMTVSILTATCLGRDISAARTVINAVLWINVSSILLQYSGTLIFDSSWDIHNSIFPFSRESEMDPIHGFGFARFNGIQLEPGTYAVMTGLLTLLSLGVSRRISAIHILAFLSLFLCRSVSALIFVVAIFLLFNIRLSSRHFVFHSILSIFLIILAGIATVTSGFDSYLWNRLDVMVSGYDGSVNAKFANILYIFNAELGRQMIGSGFMVNDCGLCMFINSNGVLFSLVFYLGVLGLGYAAYLFFGVGRRSYMCMAIIGTVLFSRLTLYHAALWTTVLFVYYLPNIEQE